MDRQTHPPSEFIQSRKHWNILCFFWIFMLKLVWVSILKYCTHEMRAFFPRHWNPGKGGWEHFVEQTSFVPPTLMRTAGFVRQEEWLEFFFFPIFNFILALLWQLVGILNSLRLTGSTASCETKSDWLVFYLSFPPKSSLLLVVIYALLWVITV